MGSCRMACVRLKANSELLSLRTGERAGDLIFEEMDSKAGWAEFRQGTNQVRIWLHSYCASAAATPVESSRALKRQQALKRSGEAAANDSLSGVSEDSQPEVLERVAPYPLLPNPSLLKPGA